MYTDTESHGISAIGRRNRTAAGGPTEQVREIMHTTMQYLYTRFLLSFY